MPLESIRPSPPACNSTNTQRILPFGMHYSSPLLDKLSNTHPPLKFVDRSIGRSDAAAQRISTAYPKWRATPEAQAQTADPARRTSKALAKGRSVGGPRNETVMVTVSRCTRLHEVEEQHLAGTPKCTATCRPGATGWGPRDISKKVP